jgi:hypothetical protein
MPGAALRAIPRGADDCRMQNARCKVQVVKTGIGGRLPGELMGELGEEVAGEIEEEIAGKLAGELVGKLAGE